jgi:hypothetical protein
MIRKRGKREKAVKRKIHIKYQMELCLAPQVPGPISLLLAALCSGLSLPNEMLQTSETFFGLGNPNGKVYVCPLFCMPKEERKKKRTKKARRLLFFDPLALNGKEKKNPNFWSVVCSTILCRSV